MSYLCFVFLQVTFWSHKQRLGAGDRVLACIVATVHMSLVSTITTNHFITDTYTPVIEIVFFSVSLLRNGLHKEWRRVGHRVLAMT